MSTEYNPAPAETVALETYFNEKRQLVNEELKAIFAGELKEYGPEEAELVKAMEYTLMGEAKRLRPLLTIATYELFNKDSRAVAAPACSIELVHTASLMYDDLPCMDNATMRRGKPAHHLVFGEATTILASAALFSAAFKILSEIKSIKINELVSETATAIGGRGLIKGQFMDVKSFGKAKSIEELDRAYYLKTAVLFRLSAKLGALLTNATPEQIKAIEQIGGALGLAFQIRDDVLDAELTLQEAGKDVKIDSKNDKPTYVSILGKDGAKIRLSGMLDGLQVKAIDLKKQNLQTDTLVGYIEKLRLK